MLLNGAAHIEETGLPFLQFTLLHSVTCVQLRLIAILGNCGCVAVVSFLRVPSPLQRKRGVVLTSNFFFVRAALYRVLRKVTICSVYVIKSTGREYKRIADNKTQ
jgi:hypothetical protein